MQRNGAGSTFRSQSSGKIPVVILFLNPDYRLAIW
jgi:hypothetical protein